MEEREEFLDHCIDIVGTDIRAKAPETTIVTIVRRQCDSCLYRNRFGDPSEATHGVENVRVVQIIMRQEPDEVD